MTANAPLSLTILLVEDSPTQAEALRALLAEQGWTVALAKSGEAALDAIRAARPDLVLSDIVMPGMSGYELCRTIKDDPALRGLPVMLLTSLSDPLDIFRGLECGADNYITKPYDDVHLVSRVRNLFANRALRAARTGAGDNAVGITFLGERFTIASEKDQILDLLVSSFEELVRTNEALRASEAERAALYEREHEARMEAEEANRAKSAFLATMSHELRTPLNAIGGYVELVELGVRGPVTEGQKEYLRRIAKSSHVLLSLINDILNFAKLEAGSVEFRMSDVLLDSLLRGVATLVEPQLRAKKIQYAYSTCDALLKFHGDPERVEQIILNLLTNAVKFTEPGGSVTLSCETTDLMISVYVTDTGRGIPADKLEAIFDPFVQVDRHLTDGTQGTGLGLSIARDLARRMHGDLRAEQRPGGGSVFILTLPRI